MLVSEMGRGRLVAGAVIVLALSGLSGTAWAETSITTANTSEDVDVESGDATVVNEADVQTGQQGDGDNEQQGDTSADASQDAQTVSGAAVSGQVVGGVSEDDLSIDASNATRDSSAETGESTSDNVADILAGLIGEDVGNVTNTSEGEITGALGQEAHSVSGDAVTGQYVGAQTYSGNADVVVSNATENSSSESGTADENNDGELSVGQFINGIEV